MKIDMDEILLDKLDHRRIRLGIQFGYFQGRVNLTD